MKQSPAITAILLAGGQGSRMDYRDKAWVPFDKKPLVRHVIDIIQPQVDEIIVSQNENHPGWNDVGFKCFEDAESLGPLSGILACLPGIRNELTLVVPCDIPNLPEDLIAQLNKALEATSSDVAVAEDSHGQQNLVFLAKSACLTTIEDYLASGNRSVNRWLASQSKTNVRFRQSFENINESGQLR